jgi:hypothetical protein
MGDAGERGEVGGVADLEGADEASESLCTEPQWLPLDADLER